MKNIWIIAGLLLTFPVSAKAQEQQVYSPYSQPTFGANAQGAGMDQSAQQAQAANKYMTYPGREQYGDRYGYIPRHPGDYRDAVDRGQWEGGGGARMPRRSFNGY